MSGTEQPQQTEPDYKALLLKYIEHVGRCEGVAFLSNHQRGARSMETSFQDTSVFTDEEWAVMQVLNEDRTYRQTHIPLPKNWNE